VVVEEVGRMGLVVDQPFQSSHPREWPIRQEADRYISHSQSQESKRRGSKDHFGTEFLPVACIYTNS
jgi:hypothetical protein